MPASQTSVPQPPSSASTAQQSPSLAAPVSQAQPMQSPVSVATAQQADHPMPQASSPQPQSGPEQASAAPSLAAAASSASAAAAVPQAAVPLPQSEVAPPVATFQPGSSTAPEAQIVSSTESREPVSAAPEAELVSGTEAPSPLATPDARGTSEPHAQRLSSTPPEAPSSPGPASKQEASASPVQTISLSKEEGTLNAVESIEAHALSNGNAHAKEAPSDKLEEHITSSQLQKQTDDSKAPAQLDAGVMNSVSEVSTSAAQRQDMKQQNGLVQSESEHTASSKVASSASAGPGQIPAEQLSRSAAQASQPGQHGQTAQTPMPTLSSAQPEQLPISAPTAQRPGSLTKASPLPSLASTVTQQWLGSSQASALRPAPQQGKPFVISSKSVPFGLLHSPA